MAVGKYPQRTVEKIKGADKIPGDKIVDMALCGRLFMATDKGIAYQSEDSTWSSLAPVNKQLASETITQIGCHPQGSSGLNLAIGTGSGLYLYTGGEKDGKLKKAGKISGRVTALDTSASLAAGAANGLFMFGAGAGDPVPVPAFQGREVRAVAVDADGYYWLGFKDGLVRFKDKSKENITYTKENSGLPDDDVRGLYLDDAGILWIATPSGLGRFDRKNQWTHITGKEHGLPYEDILTVAGVGSVGEIRRNPKFRPFEETGVNPGGKNQLWVGTSTGAALYDGYEWHYFQGPQYLENDRVDTIVVDGRNTAWLVTPGGASHVVYEMTTLEQKAAFFTEQTQKYQNRYGLVSGCTLTREGDPASCTPTTSDNDGLWTGMYVAAECYRYGATGDPEAKRLARQSLDSIMFLETVNESPGFVSRSFAKPDEPHCNGEWDHITSDGQWRWKGDTSSDEIDGHMYVYSVYYDICADDREKAEIREKVSLIMGHIVDNDFYLIDVDGKHTSWGRWNPEVFTTDGPFLKGLNSLEILSYLMTAIHITGESKFIDAYRYLIKEHGYARNTVKQKLSHLQIWNHSDDELAFLAYYPLLKYETLPFLMENYHKSLERSWQIERSENNPLFNFIYGSEFPGDFDLEESVWMLQRIPMTTVRYPHTNSHRADVEIDHGKGRFNEVQSVDMLPFDERTLHIWNENPFRLDGRITAANYQQPGTWYLLPYWMGRYYGFIVETE